MLQTKVLCKKSCQREHLKKTVKSFSDVGATVSPALLHAFPCKHAEERAMDAPARIRSRPISDPRSPSAVLAKPI